MKDKAPVKTLTVLRHAKSGWDEPAARDFDRSVNERGKRAAKLIGEHARAKGLAFDRIVASPAVRVVDTLDVFQAAMGNENLEPTWDRRIYLASSASLLDVLRDVPDHVVDLLMVGHNPGLEDLILELVPDVQEEPLRAIPEDKFPTAALAVMELPIDKWADVRTRSAHLTHVICPRDLDPELGPED